MASLTLHGLFHSPYPYRVIWALKLKGVDFDYVEENLQDKSPELLKYNPVQRKVPLLVHNGRPICESMVIVEYIDETWPNHPLLPVDPLERANARFWVRYIDEKIPTFPKLMLATGEELEDARKDVLQVLQTIEEGALGDGKFFGGDELGYLDIAFGFLGRWLGACEEISGFKIQSESGKLSRLWEWMRNFEEHPVIKENLPDRDRMISIFMKKREKMLAAPP